MPRRLASVDELSNGRAVKFQVVRKGRNVSAFVAQFQGEIIAYENVCQHLPLPLDYGDKQFFSRDGRHLLCQTHGAIYEPLSGLCVRGPCEGDSLKKIKVEVRDGAVWLLED